MEPSGHSQFKAAELLGWLGEAEAQTLPWDWGSARSCTSAKNHSNAVPRQWPCWLFLIWEITKESCCVLCCRPQNTSSKPTSTGRSRRSRSSSPSGTGWTPPFTSRRFAPSACCWTSYLKQICEYSSWHGRTGSGPRRALGSWTCRNLRAAALPLKLHFVFNGLRLYRGGLKKNSFMERVVRYWMGCPGKQWSHHSENVGGHWGHGLVVVLL